MNKIDSINNDAAANVNIDCSYSMIKTIVPPSHRRENQNHNKRRLFVDSRLKSTRNEIQEEQSIIKRRIDDNLVDEIVERLETKMDQKIRNCITEIIEPLSIQVSKLTESVEFILNNFVNCQNKRDRLRSRSRSSKRSRVSRSRSISRSRSRSRSQSQDGDQHHHHHPNHGERSQSREAEGEQIAAESLNLIDNETIAYLREKYSKPRTFAINLMLKLFTMDEMTLENVNVEGKGKRGSKVRAVALSPTRVAELKRHCLVNVAINERKSAWKECKKACNHKLRYLREKKEDNNNASRSGEREQHNQHRNHDEREREQTTTPAVESNLIDNETLASLSDSTPTTIAMNLMPKLFTMEEMTVENVNLEANESGRCKQSAVGLSPRRVAELKRHCLQNVPLHKRESTWRDCKNFCNEILRLVK